MVGAFNLTKLIRICKELDIAMEQQFFAVTMLTQQVLIDACRRSSLPHRSRRLRSPIAPKSFKEAMQKLDDLVRKIAHSHLHTHIRNKEVLPTWQQVNIGTLLDVLLDEIVRVLK